MKIFSLENRPAILYNGGKELSDLTHTELLPAAPRTALMTLLNRLSAAKRLIYIHAPAGYGKSFSARMWLKNVPHAWIAISKTAGRRPSDLSERLTLALLSIQPDNTELREIMTQKSFSAAPLENAQRAVKTFGVFNALHPRRVKTFLVIDDLHLVTNPETQERLPELILALQESVTLLILSRAEPPGSFSEFLLKDWMAVVDVEHLKFTEKEVTSFFASRNRVLTGPQTHDVMAATGGWAIGLNALLLSDSQKYSDKKLNLYLETFIREQVWDKWNQKQRDFLLRVSISDELIPAFCDAMTGQTDSAEVLDALVRENAFISVDGEGVYRFHQLFQDFLRNLLDRENEKLKKGLYQKAGDWFYGHADYYRAVEYYMRCGSKDGIVKGLTLMYDYNSPYASVEETAAIIHLSVDAAIVGEYPFLLETLAWAAFVEGRGKEMEGYIERYFSQLPKVIMQNPASALTSILLRCMDYRNNLADVLRKMQKIPFKRFARANTPSITQNMPFYHRSGRDFSELLPDEENNFAILRKTWGVLLKDEWKVVENTLRAGLAYERGELDLAHELALSACAAVQERFAPETLFCAYMIRAAAADAQGNHADMKEAIDEAAAMIGRHKAYYLDANVQAFYCRQKMNEGDMAAARGWLKYNADQPHTPLTFFKLYRHFTTARAYIVIGEYSNAIVLLKKTLALCELYRRPLDIMETKILLAIAYWKKGGNMAQNEAMALLESAILSAEVYGYRQIFLNESAELSNILHRLQKRVIQKDYAGGLSASQVKPLYIMLLPRTKHSKGLTGGRARENVKFTERQKEVMRYMCEGLTHREIGEKMGIKFSAVKSHTILIYKKLDVSNGTDAMIKIQELGWLK